MRIADDQKVFAEAPPPKAVLTVVLGHQNRPYGGSLASTENPERLGATLNGPRHIVNNTAGVLDRFLKHRKTPLRATGPCSSTRWSVKLEVVKQ